MKTSVHCFTRSSYGRRFVKENNKNNYKTTRISSGYV